MAKSTFENIDEEISKQPETAPVVTATSEIVTDDFFSNEGFEGEIDQSNIRTPYLSLTHGVGPLAEAGFVPGALVYNKEHTIAAPSKGEIPLKDGAVVTLLAGFQEFVEDVSNEEFNNGIKPRRFRKEQEAREAGLITPKQKRTEQGMEEMRVYRPALQFKVLLQGKGPEGFPLECPVDGKSYQLAALAITKGSFWQAGQTLLAHINECRILKRQIRWKPFTLTTKLDKIKGASNSTWAIRATAGVKHSPEFMAWLEELGV